MMAVTSGRLMEQHATTDNKSQIVGTNSGQSSLANRNQNGMRAFGQEDFSEIAAQQQETNSQQLARQRQESQLWLSRWAHIWTKRQSPEWKPRRASVATCQRLQQQCHQQQTLYYHRQQNRKDSTNSLKLATNSGGLLNHAGDCASGRKKKSSLQLTKTSGLIWLDKNEQELARKRPEVISLEIKTKVAPAASDDDDEEEEEEEEEDVDDGQDEEETEDDDAVEEEDDGETGEAEQSHPEATPAETEKTTDADAGGGADSASRYSGGGTSGPGQGQRKEHSATGKDSLCCCCLLRTGQLVSGVAPGRPASALTSKHQEVNRSSCCCRIAANGSDDEVDDDDDDDDDDDNVRNHPAALTATSPASHSDSDSDPADSYPDQGLQVKAAATSFANCGTSSSSSCGCSCSSSLATDNSSFSSSLGLGSDFRANLNGSSAKNNSTKVETPPQSANKSRLEAIKKLLTINDNELSLQVQQRQRKSLIRSIMRRMVSEDCLRVYDGQQSNLLTLQQQPNNSNNNNCPGETDNNNTVRCAILKRRETTNELSITQLQVTEHLNNFHGNDRQEANPMLTANCQSARQRRRGETNLRYSINGLLSQTFANRKGAASATSLGSGEHQQCADEEQVNAEERLEAAIVESWLDDHPKFVRDYIVRKANHQLIQDWLITNAKLNNLTTTRSAAASHEQVKAAMNDCEHDDERLQRQVNHRVTSDGGCEITSIRTREDSQSLQQAECKSEIVSASPEETTCVRSHRSSSQSGGSRLSSPISMPVRKISATDFETRTGSGYLRPMVSRTPDGRPTFLSQLDVRSSSPGKDLFDKGKYISELENERRRRKKSTKEDSSSESSSSDKQVIAAAEHDELGLIFELVKNICNDLDIRTLLHKILKNIAVLINADKSSLFLVRGDNEHGSDGKKHLVSQLFNVDQESDENDMEQMNKQNPTITIPWGTGLVGYVAASGESINIANCYEDPRFTDTIDQQTGYVTRNMLCAPILDKRNEIVGVAQVINKRDGNQFSASDELKFNRYLQFCGIGLRNAQSYENCQLENRRNQVILDLARMIFEEQSTIEQVVHKIILHTQSLFECERCQVLLIDDGSEDLEQLLQVQAIGPPVGGAGAGAGDCNSNDRPGKRPKWRPQCSKPAGSKSPSSPEDQQTKSEKARARTDGANCHPACKQGEEQSSKLFSLVFDLECSGTNNDLVMHNRNEGPTQLGGKRKKFPINIGITGYVAMTGETLNIEDAHKCPRFEPSVDENSTFKHKSILCMPIRNGKRQIIGVSQLINKKNGRPFNKSDEDLFEAFSIFCGLGIHNTLMYEKVLKIMAKQRVTFEVLSYHATAPLEEAKKLHHEQIPSSYSLNLTSLKFNDFSLDEQLMLKSCLRFFLDLDLMRRFQIDQLVFCNWILSVQKNYRTFTYHPIVGGNGLTASPVRYHNWRHAFNVSQMMFAILINTQVCRALGELETLALLIACLCHDLDHRGTNNSFQIKSASPLAELYSTSTMEHHHFDQCVMILNSQGNQILANLSPEEYSRVISLLEEAILATDLANYFQKRELFFQLVETNQFDWRSNHKHRSLLRCMLMTACDVAAITKPWSIQKIVADLVMSEFYQQGDIEKNELHIEPSDLMNREKMSKLPEMQIGFIDTICAPIYTAFAKLFPTELKPLLDGCLSNRELWHELAHGNKKN